MLSSRSLRARSRIFVDGASRLGGINVGRFPVHRFAFDLRPAPTESWPLRLLFAGDDEWARGCYRFRQNSDTFAVEFVREGSFLFRQDGAEYDLRPGRVFILRRGASNETGCFVDRRARKLVAAMDGDLLEALLAGLRLDRVDTLESSDPERLEDIFRRAELALRDEGPGSLERGALVAHELLMELARDARVPAWPEKLRRILAHIERRLERPFSIKALASAFDMSPATLHRLFRAHLNKTPVQYLTARRIEMAKRMLTLTETPIKGIAARTGYANVFYFSASFARHVGESPRHYRLRRHAAPEGRG